MSVSPYVVIDTSRPEDQPAFDLYQRLGFRGAPLPHDAMYLTADVYMEMDILEPGSAT